MLPINKLENDEVRHNLDNEIINILAIPKNEINLTYIYKQIIQEPQFNREDLVYELNVDNSKKIEEIEFD